MRKIRAAIAESEAKLKALQAAITELEININLKTKTLHIDHVQTLTIRDTKVHDKVR